MNILASTQISRPLMTPQTPQYTAKDFPSAERVYFYSGIAAAMDSKAETANPHHSNTAPARAWLAGFRSYQPTSATEK